MKASPQTEGAALGLLAAALFGLSAPLSKLLLPSTGPLLLASLLYLGGGGGLTVWRLVARRPVEAKLAPRDLPWLAGIIGCGGILGPLLMLFGLRRLSGFTGSLLLNLEGPFTVLLAVGLFGEHVSRRALAAMLFVFGGAAATSVSGGELRGDWLGALLLAGACAAWAVDNNLTQRLSLKDPVQLVQVKALGAGACTLAIAFAFESALPPLRTVGAALAVGVFSYGVSILLDTYALRKVGAAREAAYFATAPFIGALASLPLLGDRPSWQELLGGAAIAAGVLLLLRERHGHLHSHEALEHTHRHVHDAHHQHAHEGPVTEPHAHPHRHAPLTHDHPHASDLHHRHRH